MEQFSEAKYAFVARAAQSGGARFKLGLSILFHFVLFPLFSLCRSVQFLFVLFPFVNKVCSLIAVETVSFRFSFSFELSFFQLFAKTTFE